MSDELDRKQMQTELVGDDLDWVEAAIHAALVNVHTAAPGSITSYDKDKQTCSVQLAIKRVYTLQGAMALPVLQDVPVVFHGGALTYDIEAGDEALVVIAERCIDAWFANGGVQTPEQKRMHDLSDGFALVGPNSLKRLIAAIGDGTELRLRNGSCRIAIRADGRILLGISQGSPAGDAELFPMVHGLVLGGGIDTLTELPYSVLGSSSLQVMAKK